MRHAGHQRQRQPGGEPHEQGAAAGYLSAANTSGAILGPVVGTSLYKIAPNVPMLLGGVLMVLISIYAFTIPEPEPRRPKWTKEEREAWARKQAEAEQQQ